MTTAHLVVPAGFDDPARPSGGNVYDQRLVAGLRQLGWTVAVHQVSESRPLGRVLAAIPDRAVALVDGLVASALPEVVGPESRRLRLVVLLHLPLGEDRSAQAEARTRERAVLGAAAAVVVTSRWTRGRVLARYELAADRVRVAEPGAEPAAVATGSRGGGSLLCVGAVAPHKGQDVLVEALAAIRDLAWDARLVGRLDVDPGFARRLADDLDQRGLGERIGRTGPLSGTALDAAYLATDLLVVPSHLETYGMVVTEALAHGLPVLASSVGGVPEAMGRAAGGGLPGLLVPPGDSAALAEALRCWLTLPALRAELRAAALERRRLLPSWSETALEVAKVLDEVAA